MNTKTYYVFISHAWDYNHHYEKIVEFLNKAENFSWRDYSVPMDDPIHTNGTEKDLYEKIESKVKYSSCLLLLGGVYTSYRKWMQKEIEMAKKWNKPIITIKLWDADRTSDIAQENATEIVNWQTSSIINAIKKHG